METNSNDQKLEAVLFYKAEPVQYAELRAFLELTEEELHHAIDTLQDRLKNSALTLLQTDTELGIAVDASFDTLLESIRADELSRTIGRAGAETLAIVLYRNPVSRSEIDRIRGVNSAQVIRSLSSRGLIESHTHKNRTEYRPTVHLLTHLGVKDVSELPDYHDILKKIEQFEEATEV